MGSIVWRRFSGERVRREGSTGAEDVEPSTKEEFITRPLT